MHMPPVMTGNIYETANVTFRTYALYADLMRRAAKAQGVRLSDYIRDLVVPQAARDLGEELPPLPRIEKGRYGSAEAKAAKARGMSLDDFRAWAAQQMTLQVLAESGLPEPHPTGRRKARRQ
jgi:uncharacterized protein (DUF1778 family)